MGELIEAALFGLGLVAIVEGLVLAILPGRVREALEALARMEPEHRRLVGLLSMTLGIALVWAARA